MEGVLLAIDGGRLNQGLVREALAGLDFMLKIVTGDVSVQPGDMSLLELRLVVDNVDGD